MANLTDTNRMVLAALAAELATRPTTFAAQGLEPMGIRIADVHDHVRDEPEFWGTAEELRELAAETELVRELPSPSGDGDPTYLPTAEGLFTLWSRR